MYLPRRNESLKSLFTFTVHLWKEDVNGKAQYNFTKGDLGEVECNTIVPIGQKIQKSVSPLSIDDVISMDVDLIHQWHDHRNCRAETTRISFI